MKRSFGNANAERSTVPLHGFSTITATANPNVSTARTVDLTATEHAAVLLWWTHIAHSCPHCH